ncbi:MAG: flippase [Candidatus Uhrbacteria bacterium]|nr:flippase [Candidatus Uhrbacteria bacterium]
MISAQSLAKNFTIQTAGKIFSILIGLATIAILTRALSTEQFGEYTTTTTFLQFFGILVDFGFTLTLLVMISEKGAHEEHVIGNFLGLRLVSGFILFACAPIIVLALPYSSTIKQAVTFGAFAYFLMGGASLLVGIFQKYEAMWRAALAELINRFVLLLTIIILAWFHFGVIAFVAAMILANAVWFFVMIRFAKPFIRVRSRFEITAWKKILSRSWPIAVSIIFNLMYLKGDILLLSLYRTQVEVGLYGVAYRIIDILTVIPTMFMGLLLPSLTHAWTNGDHEQFRSKLSRTFDLFMIFVIPIIAGAQIVGVKLIQFIAGAGYEQSGEVMKILILALFGVFVGTLFGHLVVALNKQRAMIFGYASAAILTLAGYLFTIPRYGMYGAAWMTVFSELFIAMVTFVVVYKTSRVLPHLGAFLKSVFAALVMSGFLLILPSIHVILDILFGALVYFVVMILIRGINLEDARLLLPGRSKKSV